MFETENYVFLGGFLTYVGSLQICMNLENINNINNTHYFKG